MQKTSLDLFGERLEHRLAELQREIAEDLNGLRQDVDKKLDGLRQDVDRKLDGLRQNVNQKLDGLRSFVLGAVGVGVALISLVIVLVQWLK